MGEIALEKKVGQLLRERRWTISTAESCTGGLISHRLTNVSGSSDYVIGGVVAYANEAKERVLGVRHQTLLEHGAVSEETALEMSRGARRLFGTDVALSATGIAGPTGGIPQKPVGLVYIALSTPESDHCQRHIWSGDRLENKEQSAEAALRMLLEYLDPGYSGQNTR